MTGALIGAMLGLGFGLVISAVMEWDRISHWVATTLGPVLIFSAIGWSISLAPDKPQCEAPDVYVSIPSYASTPSIKGCMHPDHIKNLDPEVLKQ